MMFRSYTFLYQRRCKSRLSATGCIDRADLAAAQLAADGAAHPAANINIISTPAGDHCLQIYINPTRARLAVVGQCQPMLQQIGIGLNGDGFMRVSHAWVSGAGPFAIPMA